MLSDNQMAPKLAIFEHFEGSRVGNGLFPAYQLPNGKMMYMYYNGGQLLDEVSTVRVPDTDMHVPNPLILHFIPQPPIYKPVLPHTSTPFLCRSTLMQFPHRPDRRQCPRPCNSPCP